MKIQPVKPKADPFEELSPLQKTTRKAAIALAFVGVFVWVLKILLF